MSSCSSSPLTESSSSRTFIATPASFMERLGIPSRVENDDINTDPGPRLKSIKAFKQTAQTNKSASRVAGPIDLNDAFLQQYSQVLKRKRGQYDDPKKRVASTFSPTAQIGDMGLHDTYLDINDDDNFSDSDESDDSDENSTGSYDHRKTSTNATGSRHPREYTERHNRRVKHWRSWCHRKRYPDDVVTAEKYSAYIKESLAPKSHHDRNNPHLEILPIRIGATDSDEGEIPAWETVVSYISAVRSLYQEQCESMGLRPDIDGTMATPATVAVISQFRSSQDMPQFVQAPSYQLKLKGALRYLWMKGYNEQECAYVNQWCGTRTRLCLAFDRFKGPRHVLRKNLLTSLYPVYHMDYTSTRSVFAVATASADMRQENHYIPTFTRLFRHSDIEVCPVGCLAIYLFALWMDEGSQPNFRNHEWQSFHLLQPSDSSKAVSEQTYKRHIGVALGMAEAGAAAARNQRTYNTSAGWIDNLHHADNVIGTDIPLIPYSMTDIPTKEPYKLTARLHLAGEYSVLRDAVVPPLELQRQIFPFIEKLFPINDDWKAWIDNIMMNRPEDTYRSRNWRVHYSKEYLPAIRLMLVLAHLRKIILQDIVAMKMCAGDIFDNKHRIANSPVFSSMSFYRFEHQLQEAMHGRATRSSAKDRNHAKFQFIRQRSPIVDVVSNTLTVVCGSSLAQLPTPTEDEDANTTLVDPHSLESEFTSQQSMTSCYGNKLQELPQELFGILPTDDDDADILEIKKSLASMFRYMETESKAVGNFASATFASLDQLQGQMASAEKTVQMLLAKQDALESRSSEQMQQESDLRLLSFQQEPRILEQWLQLQNKLRPWEKNRKQDAGSRQGRTEDSEAQTERSFDMDALRQKMSCTKAVNLDVKRRISNLEADLLAVGNSLRAVAGVGDTEEGAEVETEAKDEEGNDKHRDVSGDDERDESGEDEQEKTPIDSAALRMTRFGRRMVEPIQQVSRQSYPDDLVELADRIAALYPQLKPDKIRDVDLSDMLDTQLLLRQPTIVRDVWQEWFSAQGSRPSFWSLDRYIDGWRAKGEVKAKATMMTRKKIIINATLREIDGIEGRSLKARVAKALSVVQNRSKQNSLYEICCHYNSKGYLVAGRR